MTRTTIPTALAAPLRTAAVGAALLGAAALAALPAAAQGPATITGHVYACDGGRPLAHAAVRLRGLDDGQTIALTSDRNGHFARVGLMPGRYLIEAAAPLPVARRGTVTGSRRRLRAWPGSRPTTISYLRIGTDAAGRLPSASARFASRTERSGRSAPRLRRPARADRRAHLRPDIIH